VTDAVIVAAARTPIGRTRKGSLVDVDAFRLAEIAVGEVVDRSGIASDDIDDLVVAETLQGGGVIARHTAVVLGMTNVPGLSDNRHCAAGLSAVAIGASGIKAGMDQVVVSAGTESLSTAPRGGMKRLQPGQDPVPWMSQSHPETPDAPAWDMSITVGENTSREMGLTRRDLDEWALFSTENALRSIDEGRFDNEIVAVPVIGPDGVERMFAVDEHPRRGTTLDTLGALPFLHPEIEGATITAGNAAGLNDGAAAVVMTSGEYAAAHGLAPIARIVSWAAIGLEPARTGMAPTLAIPKALDRAGLAVADIDRWEINEAFCSVAVAAMRTLGIPQDRMNQNGSGASLGHPIACTGARMVVTMVNELHHSGSTLGCISMCAGGGMGAAMIIEAI
jgi:acetyl-CoA acetyltransferase family protein